MATKSVEIRSRVIRLLAVGAAWLGAGVDAATAESETILVFAASSLTDVVDEARRVFGDTDVMTVFGPSSVLARQIRDGAPADVFLSASLAWMADLEAIDGLDGPPIVVAKNRLVVVGSHGVPRVESLERLAAAGRRVGVADAGVPAGEYARAALRSVDLFEVLRPRLVGLSDVRSVLAAVERGELDAGFVYDTDARAGDVDTWFTVDSALHPPIEVPAAVVADARSPERARAFVEFLIGDDAQDIFQHHGFVRRSAE